ncbi:MAG: oligoendopeptidase F [Firmicutes bacterium]|jgi:oligoendopeptidase F|nr:oligoendopeptidase F [Bacillota bacterium]
MERKDVETKYTWDLSPIFPSDEAWEKEYKDFEKAFENSGLSSYQGKLGDKEKLLGFFKLRDTLSRRLEKLYLYASMKHDEDIRVSKYTSYTAMMSTLVSKLMAEMAFVEPELTALDDEKLKAYIADPDFAAYDYTLEKIEQSKAHVLSEGEEKLLALASDVMGGFHTVFTMLDNADLNLPKGTFNGEEVQMSHSLYGLVLHAGNRKERETWFKDYYKAYIDLIDAITQTYYGNVKKDIFYKTARKYDTCLEMAMDGEDVSPVVYNNLVESVHGALPVLHRYMAVRKKILGFDEQHMYDIHIPLVSDADIKVPFEEAYEIVVKGLAPLGKDYQSLLRRGKEERWIDVYETEGKRNGAYSTGVYDTHPYVLLNYQETTNEIFTIAHEMGHSIHTYKSTAGQPYAKSEYTIFLAEIASTVNEVLLMKYLYKTSEDKQLKKYLLNYYIDMMRTTLFRQTQFAEFEQLAHAKAEAGEPLTKENLCEAYYQLNKDYYGEAVVHDTEISYEWARIPHFYRSFYVYKYSTGIISAISIVKRILSEGEGAVKDYFEFLSGGNSTDPVSILKKAGVDLTTKAPFETAMKEFADTLNEFESLTV